MKSDRQLYTEWFADVLEELYLMKAGFPIMLVVLPILERYLREKSGVGEGRLGKEFYSELIEVFPVLTSNAIAKSFWHIYRNGLLHQLTFSRQNSKKKEMPSACITFDQDSALRILDSNRFSVNPISFSQRVNEEILRNFDHMKSRESPSHPWAHVFHSEQDGLTGTSSDPRW